MTSSNASPSSNASLIEVSNVKLKQLRIRDATKAHQPASTVRPCEKVYFGIHQILGGVTRFSPELSEFRRISQKNSGEFRIMMSNQGTTYKFEPFVGAERSIIAIIAIIVRIILIILLTILIIALDDSNYCFWIIGLLLLLLLHYYKPIQILHPFILK